MVSSNNQPEFRIQANKSPFAKKKLKELVIRMDHTMSIVTNVTTTEMCLSAWQTSSMRCEGLIQLTNYRTVCRILLKFTWMLMDLLHVVGNRLWVAKSSNEIYHQVCREFFFKILDIEMREYFSLMHSIHYSMNFEYENQEMNYSPAAHAWGPATAHGVGLLTEMYAIFTYLHAKNGGRRSNGSTFFGAEICTIP